MARWPPWSAIDSAPATGGGVVLKLENGSSASADVLIAADGVHSRVRELLVFIELHLELVARRMYGGLFFGGKFSDETKAQVEKGVAKGVRALKAVAKFECV